MSMTCTVYSRQSYVTPCVRPTLEEIASEWDLNAEERYSELESGVDTSFYEVLYPNARDLLGRYTPGDRVIDVGCGLGYMANLLSRLGYNVDGVDISAASIELASRRFPDLRFQRTSIRDFAQEHPGEYDACIANMVFHNLPSLDANIASIRTMLREPGMLVVSIPHPCYWYRRHFVGSASFRCVETAYYKVPFKIRSGRTHPSPITYVHRPVSRYAAAISGREFRLLDVVEPAAPYCSYPDVLFLAFSKQSEQERCGGESLTAVSMKGGYRHSVSEMICAVCAGKFEKTTLRLASEGFQHEATLIVSG